MNVEKAMNYWMGFVGILTFCIIGFFGWVIIKLLQYFGVI